MKRHVYIDCTQYCQGNIEIIQRYCIYAYIYICIIMQICYYTSYTHYIYIYVYVEYMYSTHIYIYIYYVLYYNFSKDSAAREHQTGSSQLAGEQRHGNQHPLAALWQEGYHLRVGFDLSIWELFNCLSLVHFRLLREKSRYFGSLAPIFRQRAVLGGRWELRRV
jgi:hypothetical protein